MERQQVVALERFVDFVEQKSQANASRLRERGFNKQHCSKRQLISSHLLDGRGFPTVLLEASFIAANLGCLKENTEASHGSDWAG